MNNGVATEIRFMQKVSEIGYEISIPVSHDCSYDVIVDNGSVLFKVQVKSTRRHETSSRLDAYNVLVSHGCKSKKKYLKNDYDIIAIYVCPYDTWYLFSHSDVGDKKTLKLYPHREVDNKYEYGKERWSIFSD